MSRSRARRSGGGTNKWRIVMHEFAHGQLHSGSKSGRIVTRLAQARAIAASEQRRYDHGGR